MKALISRGGFGNTFGAEAMSGLEVQPASTRIDQTRPATKRVKTRLRELISKPGEAPLYSLKDLESFGGAKGGFKLINYKAGPIFSTFKPIGDALTYMKQNGNPALTYRTFAPTEKDIQELCGFPNFIEIENATTEKA